MPLPLSRDWIRWSSKTPSNSNHSVILYTSIYKHINSLINATVDVFLSGTQFFPDSVPDARHIKRLCSIQKGKVGKITSTFNHSSRIWKTCLLFFFPWGHLNLHPIFGVESGIYSLLQRNKGVRSGLLLDDNLFLKLKDSGPGRGTWNIVQNSPELQPASWLTRWHCPLTVEQPFN